MATVYLAEDLKHQRKVAVKVLRPGLAATLGPERFLCEITLTAELRLEDDADRSAIADRSAVRLEGFGAAWPSSTH